MKRVAALYDIHGNTAALDAALRAATDMHGDTIVFGGDLALGPFPREVLDRVMMLGADSRVIRGNCDRLVVDAYDGRDLSKLPAQIRQVIEWTARQLDATHRDFLAALPLLATLDVDGLGDVLFCHATPRSDDEIMTVRTSPERVRPMIDGTSAKTIVCGHTHMQYDRTIDGKRLINAGSVGMPYGTPGAHWLRLGPDVQLVQTDYDFDDAAHAVRRSAYPDAAQFAEQSIQHPNSEEEMLRRFGS